MNNSNLLPVSHTLVFWLKSYKLFRVHLDEIVWSYCVFLQGYALSSTCSGNGCEESVGCSGLYPDALSWCERSHLFTPSQGWPTPPLRQLASSLPLLLDQLQAKNSSHSLRLIWYIQCWYYCRLYVVLMFVIVKQYWSYLISKHTKVFIVQ